MSQTDHKTQPIELTQFNQVFFEECVEHLEAMERILVSLDDRQPDEEQLNAIFRAAHSIKGGAGMFGFHDMTVVTHALESLLDKLRTQEIAYSSSMVDLFLEAGDVIAMQLARHRDGSEISDEVVDRVRTKLQTVIDQGGMGGVESIQPPPQVDPGERHYELLFTPDNDIYHRGVRLENLFSLLREMGDVKVEARLADPGDLVTLDPKDCHTSWRIELHTAARPEEILEIFEFVADEGQLQIRELADESQPAGETAATPAPAPDLVADPKAGRRAYDKNEMAPQAFGRRGSEAEASIRVGITKVDQLINQVGELVITQLMLAQTATALDPVLHESLHRSLLQLEHNTRDLQQSVMSIRLVPISVVFSRFPRLVRELSAKLGKQVELRTVGETTELDKGLIEKLTDPLTHLVRNCLDHAIETPEVRIAAGKDPCAVITLRASQLGGRIIIDIIDDGAGLNRDKILRKAGERGIPVSETMSDEELGQIIFTPGFSTADTVTDISGRGVGMDVVASNVQAMNGRVSLSTERGRGTRVTISLPLTLAILDGLSVAVGEEKFIIPLNAIVESLQPSKDNLETINGKNLVRVRGEYIPILPLHQLFNIKAHVAEADQGILVMVDVEGEKAALLVDALLDEHQVVIKSIEANYRKVEGAAGATILGDGRVALILDVGSLLLMHKRQVNVPHNPTERTERR